MRANPINPGDYQNNPDWALHNKQKGFYASCFSGASTAVGCIKVCSRKDSKIYKICNFLEKVFYALSNCLQYFLFGRKDDVLGDDEEKKPLAGKVGKAATFQEKYINPIAKPALVFLDTNQQEGLNDALNFLDSFYWKLRFALDKMQWDKVKLIPTYAKQLVSPDVQPIDKNEVTKSIGAIIAPLCGWIGTVCIGIFHPTRACLGFFGRESKIVNCLAYLGKTAINIPYFFKFSLPMFWEGLITKDKKFHSAFAVGAVSNALNIGLPLVELLPKENKFAEIYKSATSNLSMVFFPLRRNLIGNDWLSTNRPSL